MAAQRNTKLVEMGSSVGSSPPDTPSKGVKFEIDIPGKGGYSVEEALEVVGYGKYQLLLLLFAGLCWIGDSMEMQVLSFLGPSARCAFDLDSNQESSLTAIVFAGVLVGNILWASVADTFGRRAAMVLSAVVVVAFGVFTAVAPNFAVLAIARCGVGFGLGGQLSGGTLLVESLRPRGRGMVLASAGFFFVVGALIVSGAAWAILPTAGWRALVLLCSLPLLVTLLGMPLLPESPAWLAGRGDMTGAKAVLNRMATINNVALPEGHLKPAPPSNVGTPMARLVAGAKGVFSAGHTRTTTCALLPAWFMGALVYYSVILMIAETSGGDTCGPDGKPGFTDKDYATIFVLGFAEVPAMVIAYAFIDRIGRKRLACAGLLTVAAFMLAFLLAEIAAGTAGVSDGLRGSLLFGARTGTAATMNALHVYTPEVYPTSIRSFAYALCSSVSRVSGALAPFLAVSLANSGHMEAATGLVAGAAAVGAVCVCFWSVETRDRAIRAMPSQAHLGGIDLTALPPQKPEADSA